jgi:hypothetical protein
MFFELILFYFEFMSKSYYPFNTHQECWKQQIFQLI